MEKYLANSLSVKEEARLSMLLQHPAYEQEFEEALGQLAEKQGKDPLYKEERWNDIVASIVHLPVYQSPRTYKFVIRWAVAAAITGLVALGLFTWKNSQDSILNKKMEIAADNVPGSDRAVLTLADGTRVELDSTGNTTLQQGSVAVIQQGGQLTYQSKRINEVLAYNTLSTPKGGQFRVVLPDGTIVWLNAASSLKYPTAFSAKERKVELMGEGFFEVAPDEQKPFYVQVSENVDVKVLGTQFNVNAYHDESSIKTTLLQGAIAVTVTPSDQNTKKNIVLKPHQQIRFSKASGTNSITVEDNVDVSAVIAWKNGAFNLEGASLSEIMRQLERWYDIEVVYEGKMPDIYFTGKISRRVKLSSVLKALEEWGVHFRMEGGNRLVVLP